MRLLTPTLALASLLGGCSTELLYNAAQQSQLAECRKLPDSAERQRCIERNRTSYQTYKAKAEAETGARP